MASLLRMSCKRAFWQLVLPVVMVLLTSNFVLLPLYFKMTNLNEVVNPTSSPSREIFVETSLRESRGNEEETVLYQKEKKNKVDTSINNPEAWLSLKEALNQFCNSILKLSSSIGCKFLQQNLQESCTHIGETELLALKDLLLKKKFDHFEYKKRVLGRSIFLQQCYLSRIQEESEVLKKSETTLNAIRHEFRLVRSRIAKVHIDESYEMKRQQKIKNTANLIKNELESLLIKSSDLSTCQKYPSLTCDFHFIGGLGHRIKRLVWCFGAAFVLKRRVIFIPEHHYRFPELFLNRSFCPDEYNPFDKPWVQQNIVDHNVVLRAMTTQQFRPFLPKFVPPSLKPSLQHIVDDITVWYAGQLSKFVLAPSLDMWSKIIEKGKEAGINVENSMEGNSEPIASIHVRRGDKEHEAAFQPVGKYMDLVENFFLELEVNSGRAMKRRVFIASIDEMVVSEVKLLAPLYEIVHFNWTISEKEPRTILESIVVDLFMLIHSDFFVGTYSSNVGSLVYQMRMAEHVNAMETTISLDKLWWLTPFETKQQYVAVRDHVGQSVLAGEVDFTEGTLLSTDGTPSIRNLREINSTLYEANIFGSIPRRSAAKVPLYKFELNQDNIFFNETELKELKRIQQDSKGRDNGIPAS